MPKVCVVLNCKTGTKGVDEKRSLFKPPLNDELRKKWVDAIPGLNELKQTQSVCERHFLEKHVHRKWIKYGENGQIIAQYEYPRPRLDPRAVPCIFETDEIPSLVDAWLVYKQNELYNCQVLTNNNSKKISADLTRNAQVPSKKILNTIQEVYSTGEHDYCRLKVNPSENDRNKDNSSSITTGNSTTFKLQVKKATNFQIQGQKLTTSNVQSQQSWIPKLQGQKSPSFQLQGHKSISCEPQNQQSKSLQFQTQKSTGAQLQSKKPSISDHHGQQSQSCQIQSQKALSSELQDPEFRSIQSQVQKSISSQLESQKSLSFHIKGQKFSNFQIHSEKSQNSPFLGHKFPSSQSQNRNLSTSNNNSFTSNSVVIKEEPIEASMEVEEFIDTFIQPTNLEGNSSENQNAQQITLSTPSGQREQLTPTGKSQRITLLEASFREEPAVPTESALSKAKSQENRVDSPGNSTLQLRVETGGVYEIGETITKLPYTWSVTELITNKGKQTVFSHIILVTYNNVESPVLKKSVVLEQRTGNISYYAHGRIVDVNKTKLPKKITEITSLPIALYTFQKMRVCGGVTPGNKASVIKDIYQDLMQCWRHNDCKILVERGKCEPCAKLQKTLAQKRRRAQKNSGSLRISSTWDPRDQIAVLKKKLELESRKKIHAQAQMKKLTEAFKENGVKVTFVKNITL